ncbi:hypothetical protein [Massilia sp. LC238]|uniref:hypothetical protein n=1 Tax=Massilia sp. LC238 TaxID=1502852 RepID=UPI0004E361B0|nr:hypothetical protein [Massilia sp. LC238]KFC61946.1 hypothetical protein FG94_04986 [Massilia sp. LC238]
MSFNRTGAIDRALELVKAGLEGGTIKLQGSSNYEENNGQQLAYDSAYLNGLINSVVENLLDLNKRG